MGLIKAGNALVNLVILSEKGTNPGHFLILYINTFGARLKKVPYFSNMSPI